MYQSNNRTEHLVDGLHDVLHLPAVDDAAVVDVVHLEGPDQLLLGGAGRHQVHGQQELAKVQEPVVVRVQSPDKNYTGEKIL